MQKSRMALAGTASLACFTLSGCLVGTAIEVVAETVEAGVEITGAAAGAAVDIVTPDGDKDEKKKKKKDKDD